MSTYARWRLWVGAQIECIDLSEAPAIIHERLDQLQGGESYEVEGLKLEAIDMHGETIGLGVIVAELGWKTEIGPENVFDEKKVATALMLVPRVEKAFRDMGIAAQIFVMHHIDLGG